MSKVLRAATRGSKLALWQTQHVAQLLGVEIEMVIVETSGDKTQKTNTPIEQMRGQGVFVKEVQLAVLEGKADFAVHSAKDLPSTTDDGLVLAAVPERADPRDALVGIALDDLPVGASIATGSVRRRAQLLSLRPDLKFSNLRGNVDTRLAKAQNFDAIVMALAPIQRLGIERNDVHDVDVDVMLPQVAQGALAIECRDGDEATIAQLAEIEHVNSRRAVDAERAFLAGMGSGCDLPVAAYATCDGAAVRLRVMLSSLDGSTVVADDNTEFEPVELGSGLAKRVLSNGGDRLLAELRQP